MPSAPQFGVDAIKPPMYDFASVLGQFMQQLLNQGNFGAPSNPYQQALQSPLSPSNSMWGQMTQGYGLSPAPAIMGQAAGQLGKFMQPNLNLDAQNRLGGFFQGRQPFAPYKPPQFQKPWGSGGMTGGNMSPMGNEPRMPQRPVGGFPGGGGMTGGNMFGGGRDPRMGGMRPGYGQQGPAGPQISHPFTPPPGFGGPPAGGAPPPPGQGPKPPGMGGSDPWGGQTTGGGAPYNPWGAPVSPPPGDPWGGQTTGGGAPYNPWGGPAQQSGGVSGNPLVGFIQQLLGGGQYGGGTPPHRQIPAPLPGMATHTPPQRRGVLGAGR